MSTLFGSGNKTQSTPPATSLRIQTSLEGKAIPIGWGQARLAGNLIWYGDFRAVAQSTGGGKGGLFAPPSGVSYVYYASCIFALCSGPIDSMQRAWKGKEDYAIGGSSKSLGSSNGAVYPGSATQMPWGYLTSLHPADALAYRGIAYVAFGPLYLEDQPSLPQLGYEVRFGLNSAVAGLPDADPADVITDLLTSTAYGVGFDAARIGDLSTYSAYCRATGMLVSPVLAEQSTGQDVLGAWLGGTNSEAVWSQGKFKVTPYGDQDVTGHGSTYTAPAAPAYDLTDDDFIAEPGSVPITIKRSSTAMQNNSVKIEFLDRANAYNPSVKSAQDDAAVNKFGLIAADVKAWHFFCDAGAAQMAASLALGRESVRLQYQFTLGAKFILLEPMDIVSLTSSTVPDLYRQWVRIKEISENSDQTRTLLCEEYLAGTGAAPLYGSEAPTGYAADYNAAPGFVQTPLLFEPTDQLAGGLAVWAAVCGVDLEMWGGCDVYASYGGEVYENIGRITGPARMGALTNTLATTAQNLFAQTIDIVNTLSVDLAISGGELTSVSQADALAGNTLCYVGGEFIAYQNVDLVSANGYDATYLVRGLYGSDAWIGAHPAGTPFARLDQGIAKIPFDQSRIGSTLSLKFVSFNLWGGGGLALSDVDPVTYVIQGTALATPLPDVVNMRTAFVDSVQNVTWDEIEDFRQVAYEIRKGDTWQSALTLGTVAHPPFACQGDGTYWVAAVSQPISGLIVYSEIPASILVSGSLLTSNVLAIWDEHATGWAGTFGGGAGRDGDTIRTAGSADFLSNLDVLNTPDVLNAGGNVDGSYEMPLAHVIDAGRVAACPVSITWRGAGVPVGQDILVVDDFLAMPDVLGSASSRFVEIYPEIAVATSESGGFPVWGSWQKYSPGSYVGRWFKARLILKTYDANTIAVALNFSVTVDVPDRIDHFGALACAALGSTVVFQPNGGASPAPFNGGPNGSAVPYVNVTVLDGQAGDYLRVTGTTLAQTTIQVLNSGVGVARTLNVDVQGY